MSLRYLNDPTDLTRQRYDMIFLLREIPWCSEKFQDKRNCVTCKIYLNLFSYFFHFLIKRNEFIIISWELNGFPKTYTN